MPERGIAQLMTDVRAHAAHLVAQLGADPSVANPFLQAVAALEQHVSDGPAPTRATRQASMAAPSADDPSSRWTDHRDSLLHDALRQAEAECAQFEQVLTQVPTGICMLHGPKYRYTFTNPIYDKVAGRTDMVGRTVRELFPEIVGQGIFELLDQV